MSKHAYPRNELGPALLAEGKADPAGVSGAPKGTQPTTTKTALATCTSSPSSSQDLRAVVALVMTLSATDRQRLAAVMAALVVVAEANLTPKQVAPMLGLSVSTTRSLCAAGKLGHRVGGRWRIPPTEVRALMGAKR